MDAMSLLSLELKGFLFALSALLVWRMLTRRVSLGGLLATKDANGTAVSPERVQLLIATLALSANILGGSLHSVNGTMPDVSSNWVAVFGGSGGLYAAVKAFRTFRQ
jgi:hypothetical protein